MKDKLRELYNNGSIGEKGISKAVSDGWITVEDAVEIIGNDNALEFIKNAKVEEISKACNSVIVAGVDVQIQGRKDHFNLSIEDQSNINNLFRVVELGGTEFPYQADDGTCTVYSAKEIAQIYITAQSHITTQTAYHNALKLYLLTLDTIETIEGITYGMELPEPYAQELAAKLAVAQEQMEAIVAKLEG